MSGPPNDQGAEPGPAERGITDPGGGPSPIPHGEDGSAITGRHRAGSPIVRGFHEARTGSVQYLVVCPTTKRAAIIDPVLDFDEASGSIATTSAEAILAHAESMGATVDWVLDTHPHADHLSAAHYLKGRTGARTGTGVRVLGVQALWKDIYGLPESACGRSYWDVLFEDGEPIDVGAIEGSILFSPGHTMASITLVLGDAAFINDTLFMPASGTARADFPGGDATRLYESIKAILALPDETRLFTGHDYPPAGREARWESTVAIQRATNIHWRDAPTAEAFVAMRRKRDATLPLPRLILPSLQVNIRGGRLPEPDADGRRYLKLPLDAFRTAVWS